MLGTTFWDAGPNKLGSSYKSNSGARTETANSHGGEKKNKPKKKTPRSEGPDQIPVGFLLGSEGGRGACDARAPATIEQ